MMLRLSRLRTLLITFMLGLSAVRLVGYFEEIPVKVPAIESTTPIIIRLCPEFGSRRGYLEDGYLYFSKEKGMNCTPGGGSE